MAIEHVVTWSTCCNASLRICAGIQLFMYTDSLPIGFHLCGSLCAGGAVQDGAGETAVLPSSVQTQRPKVTNSVL